MVDSSLCVRCGAAPVALEDPFCPACTAADEENSRLVGAAADGSLAAALAGALRRVLPASVFAETGVSYEMLARELAGAAVGRLSVASGWAAPEDDVFYAASRWRGRRPSPPARPVVSPAAASVLLDWFAADETSKPDAVVRALLELVPVLLAAQK